MTSVLDKIIKTSEDGVNDKMLNLLDICEEYLENQQQLSEHVRLGFFQLALAHKQIQRLNSTDCRMDIDPAIHVMTMVRSPLPNAVLSSSVEPVDEIILEVRTDKNGLRDSLLSFSGLPPPALQAAQKQFLEATLVAAKNSNRINQLRLLLDSMLDDNLL